MHSYNIVVIDSWKTQRMMVRRERYGDANIRIVYTFGNGPLIMITDSSVLEFKRSLRYVYIYICLLPVCCLRYIYLHIIHCSWYLLLFDIRATDGYISRYGWMYTAELSKPIPATKLLHNIIIDPIVEMMAFRHTLLSRSTIHSIDTLYYDIV